MTIIIVAAIAGAGLITGLLFAFSNFVMKALADLPNDEGMFATQRVNETIINPVFIVLFLGTPILCGVIAVKSAMQIDAPGSLSLLIGAIGYLIGPFGIAMLFNVPFNNRLANAERSAADEFCPDYQKRWKRWNHARTYIGALSIVFLAIGLAN